METIKGETELATIIDYIPEKKSWAIDAKIVGGAFGQLRPTEEEYSKRVLVRKIEYLLRIIILKQEPK